MPARKITINGVSNSFEWQVGNTTRFIRFEDVWGINVRKKNNGTFEVKCINGYNITTSRNIVPSSEYERFMEELKIWRNKDETKI